MQLLWSYIKRQKKILIGALVLATINQVFSLLDPQLFRLIVDRYATRASLLSRPEEERSPSRVTIHDQTKQLRIKQREDLINGRQNQSSDKNLLLPFNITPK